MNGWRWMIYNFFIYFFMLLLTAKNHQDVCSELGVVSDVGLSEAVAVQKNTQELNIINENKVRWYKIFFRQFQSVFIYLLIGASLLALFLGEMIDGLMIIFFLLLNVFLGFFQEYRSEKTVALLNRLVLSKVKVLRDGVVKLISSENVAVGDIIFLDTGDKIPADVRFIYTNNLSVDESTITGESIAVQKNADAMESPATDLFSARNLGFSGSMVIHGSAKAVVVAIGKKTVVGNISRLVTDVASVGSFDREVNTFSKFILRLIVVTVLLVFFINLIFRPTVFSVSDLVLFAVALTVGVIPEALPLVKTFALSSGARLLTHKKVIVKRLSAVQDLGGIEVLCTDKTGTLTQNKLKVADVYLNDERDKILLYANLAVSDIKKKKTEPFDIAVEKELSVLGRRSLGQYTITYQESFSPILKYNLVAASGDSENVIILRGAPEELFSFCYLTVEEKKLAYEWIGSEGYKGRRVLAIIYKQIDDQLIDGLGVQEKYRGQFRLGGIVSFVDPLKKSTLSAIKRAKQLGVQTKIITGDSPEVAGAVAYDIGLVSSPLEVIRGVDLKNLSDIECLNVLDNNQVFARITPEEKYRIIALLQQKYEVGFLGEGINDAPALKKAGVSIVVNGAADIARESADIILLDKSLSVVVDGIQEGRKVFVNTTKYIKSTLAANLGNFFAVAIISLFVKFLPMLPLQILLINLLSDFPMIAVCVDSVDSEELVSPQKYHAKELIYIAIILGLISSLFDFIFFGLFYQMPLKVLYTNWFIGSVLTELAFIYSIRTKKVFYKSIPPSRFLLCLTVIAILFTLIIPFTNVGQSVFSFVAPSAGHLFLIVFIVVIYFILSEIIKNYYYKYLVKS